MRRNTLRFAAIATSVIAAVSACSSSGSSAPSSQPSASSSGSVSAGTGSSQGASGKAPTGSPIKIGLAVAKTGYVSTSITPSISVAQAWASWVNNSQGGVAGHPVQIDVQDTAGSPAVAQSAVKKLLANGDVAIYYADPSVESAIQPLLSAANIAVIGGEGYAGLFGTTKNYFSITADNPTTTQIYALVAKAIGVHKVAVAYCAENPSCGLVDKTVRSVGKAFGVSDVGGVTVSASSPDDTAQCVALKQKGAEAVITALTSDASNHLLQSCRRQGFTGTFITCCGGINIPQMYIASGIKYAAADTSFPWWSSAAPVTTFRNVISKYASGTNIQNAYSDIMWQSLQMFKAALSHLPSGANVDRAAVISAYHQVKNETLGGLMPQPVSYTGDIGPKLDCFWFFKWENGQSHPTTVTYGTSGNGASGDLQSTCLPSNVAGG